MTDDAVLAGVAAYYEESLARYGATPQGVDWKDDRAQVVRLRQLLRLVAGDPQASVLDFGCGYGALLPLLRAAGHAGPYLGVDIAPSMVEAAREIHGTGPDHSFTVASEPPPGCDYGLASGLFNVRRGASEVAWGAYVTETVDKLAAASGRGFAYNMLSTWSDPERRRDDLHYADPVAFLAGHRRRFGREIALIHDYGQYEFTVIVRHASQTASPKPDAP